MKNRAKDELTESYDDIIAENLRDDGYAAEYLNDALSDSDPRHFLLALRRVAKSRKISMEKLANKVRLTRRGLYYALSNKGNPEWSTLSGLVNALGYRMQLKPKKAG
jgi:probable addiction module antidote protein